MAGPGLVVGYFGGTGRNQVLSQTLASTTETEFKLGNDTGVTTNIAVLSMPLQSAIQGSYTPNDQTMNPAVLNGGFNRTGYPFDANPPYNSGIFDNCKPFLVRLAGTLTPASNAANTSQFKLYLGTSKAGTNLAASSAVVQNATTSTFGFLLEAQLKWDSISQAVRGQFWYDVSGTTPGYATWATLTNAGASITSPSGLQFCASMTWGNAVGGVVNVQEFSITQL